MATATYHGEEIEIKFTSDLQECDFGVDGSPVWDEVEGVEIDALTILGVKVSPATLPAALVAELNAFAVGLDFEQ